MNTISITSSSLHFREGNSDNAAGASRPSEKSARRVHTGIAREGNEYHATVKPEGEGYIVTFAYGRRGGNLTTGRKTQNIVTLAEANKIHDKLVREKTAKGYREVGVTRQPDRTSHNDGQDSGIRCQLLNPVEETELNRLLDGTSHCLQEKHDGRRLMVRIRRRHLRRQLPPES